MARVPKVRTTLGHTAPYLWALGVLSLAMGVCVRAQASGVGSKCGFVVLGVSEVEQRIDDLAELQLKVDDPSTAQTPGLVDMLESELNGKLVELMEASTGRWESLDALKGHIAVRARARQSGDRENLEAQEGHKQQVRSAEDEKLWTHVWLPELQDVTAFLDDNQLLRVGKDGIVSFIDLSTARNVVSREPLVKDYKPGDELIAAPFVGRSPQGYVFLVIHNGDLKVIERKDGTWSERKVLVEPELTQKIFFERGRRDCYSLSPDGRHLVFQVGVEYRKFDAMYLYFKVDLFKPDLTALPVNEMEFDAPSKKKLFLESRLSLLCLQ